jgi:hypothetical protein
MSMIKRTMATCLLLTAVSACGPSPQQGATNAPPPVATSPAPATSAQAQEKTPGYNANIPAAVTTPDSVETRVGTLDFKDGMPSKATLAKVYENLDFARGFDAFLHTYQGVNIFKMRKGLLEAGVKDNEIILFSELMDAKSLYLTANADTIYFYGFIDLSKGPMVFEAPPGSLGLIDDLWFRWVIDFGLPGPDRGEGGRFLILPPDYNGPVPEGGFYVARSKTSRVLAFGRSFMQNSDPKPVVELIKRTAKIYPYTPGGPGTSIGVSDLQGQAGTRTSTRAASLS